MDSFISQKAVYYTSIVLLKMLAIPLALVFSVVSFCFPLFYDQAKMPATGFRHSELCIRTSTCLYT